MARALLVLAGLTLLGCGGGAGTVGAIFGRNNETRALVVRDAPAGAAAGRAGLKPGDEVLMIDGVYVRDLGADAIRARLRGDVGSTVRLTVVRNRDQVLHVRVTRRELGEVRPPPPREERIAE